VFEFLREKPVIRFFVEVIGLTAGAAILVFAAGYFFNWSDRTDYSDGFFIACVALAAIGSSRAVFYRPTYDKSRDQKALENAHLKALPGLAGFFARRSFNFRLLFAAALCLLLSMWIA
jgi:Na+/melibiose symporter-like transporter